MTLTFITSGPKSNQLIALSYFTFLLSLMKFYNLLLELSRKRKSGRTNGRTTQKHNASAPLVRRHEKEEGPSYIDQLTNAVILKTSPVMTSEPLLLAFIAEGRHDDITTNKKKTKKHFDANILLQSSRREEMYKRKIFRC